MIVEYLYSLAQVPAAQWNGLLADDQPFLRHEFLATLEDSGSLGKGTGWQPAHQILKDAQGRVLAAMPAYLKMHSYGEYVFDWAWANAYHQNGLSYYPKLVSAVPFTPATGPKLLVRPDADRRDHEIALRPGSTVLMYTDGLVERRNHALDAGITALLRHVQDVAALPLEDLCDAVLAMPHLF